MKTHDVPVHQFLILLVVNRSVLTSLFCAGVEMNQCLRKQLELGCWIRKAEYGMDDFWQMNSLSIAQLLPSVVTTSWLNLTVMGFPAPGLTKCKLSWYFSSTTCDDLLQLIDTCLFALIHEMVDTVLVHCSNIAWTFKLTANNVVLYLRKWLSLLVEVFACHVEYSEFSSPHGAV